MDTQKPCWRNPKEYWIWDKYRLLREDFDAMVWLQDNRCAMCEKTFVTAPRVDHDHGCCAGRRSCGKCVRGLLCQSCNTCLGGYEKVREAAERYLSVNGIKSERQFAHMG